MLPSRGRRARTRTRWRERWSNWYRRSGLPPLKGKSGSAWPGRSCLYRLAGDEDRNVRVGEPGDEIFDAPDLLAVSDELLEVDPVLLEVPESRVLPADTDIVRGAPDREEDRVYVEGLGDEIVGSGLHRKDGVVHGAEGRYHDDDDRRVDPLQFRDEGDSVLLSQLEVKDTDVGMLRLRGSERFGTAARLRHLEALQRKEVPQEDPDIGFVIDDQNAKFHPAPPCVFFGRTTVIVVPFPGFEKAWIVPPCASTIR
jgi:hypothetical protein